MFLDSLDADDCASVVKAPLLERMDALYGFSSSGNAEVRFRWCMLCIKAEMPAIVPAVVRLMTEQVI